MRNSYVYHIDNLKNDYKTTFKQIEMYVCSQYIDESTREDRLSELLDIFLTAQDANKPVSSIVGNNVEEFCKIFCSDFGIKNKLLNIADSIKILAQTMVAFSILDILIIVSDYFEGIEVDFFNALTSLNISGYLIGILIVIMLGYISNFITRNIMFKTKRISLNVLRNTTLVVVGISCAAMYLLITSTETNLINCPVWVTLLCGALYLAFYYPLNYKRIKVQKENKITFSELSSSNNEDYVKKIYETKYAKANKRNIKKGKGELSYEEFLNNEEKDCDYADKSKWFYFLLPIVTTAGFFIYEYCNYGFETYLDAIIFPVIMLSVQYAIMIFMWKASKSGTKDRRNFIAAKRKELYVNDSDSNIDTTSGIIDDLFEEK